MSVGNPEMLNAATTADGPGMGLMAKGRAYYHQFSTSKFPGSEMPGVPASVTKAMFSQWLGCLIISLIYAGELC